MQISLGDRALWAIIRGSEAECAPLVNFLNDWSQQLTTKGDGMPVYLVERGELHLLGGALEALRCRGIVDLNGEDRPDIWPEGLEDLSRCCERLLDAKILRDYQAEAVKRALAAPLGRGVVDAIMGGGKTRIAAGLAAVAASVGRGRWCYVVQNKELAGQSRSSFDELLPQMAEALGSPQAEIYATSYGGLNRIEDTAFDGCIVDECHLLPAPTRSMAYARLAPRWRLGLSGTPLDRQDGKNAIVIGLLGPVVYRVTLTDLESKGFLAKGSVRPVIFDRRRGIVS